MLGLERQELRKYTLRLNHKISNSFAETILPMRGGKLLFPTKTPGKIF